MIGSKHPGESSVSSKARRLLRRSFFQNRQTSEGERHMPWFNGTKDDKDLFVSYARADNRDGWVERFVQALAEERRRLTGGRELSYFFDKDDIRNFSHWESAIF